MALCSYGRVEIEDRRRCQVLLSDAVLHCLHLDVASIPRNEIHRPHRMDHLYSHGPTWLWPYIVVALYSYGHIWLWPYVVMAQCSYGPM